MSGSCRLQQPHGGVALYSFVFFGDRKKLCCICNLYIAVQIKITDVTSQSVTWTLAKGDRCSRLRVVWPANPYLPWREVHKRWICSSTHHSFSFTAASLHAHPLLGSLIQPERIERLKNWRWDLMKAGHSRPQDMGRCRGQQRADVQVRGFLISTRPLLHFLEHDAVFCGGKTLWVQHLLFILLIEPLMCFHLSSALKGKTHTRALDLISALSPHGSCSN